MILCPLAQLLNCVRGLPLYFVDTAVEEPTVVRAAPSDRFPSSGEFKMFATGFYFWFKGHENKCCVF